MNLSPKKAAQCKYNNLANTPATKTFIVSNECAILNLRPRNIWQNLFFFSYLSCLPLTLTQSGSIPTIHHKEKHLSCLLTFFATEKRSYQGHFCYLKNNPFDYSLKQKIFLQSSQLTSEVKFCAFLIITPPDSILNLQSCFKIMQK